MLTAQARGPKRRTFRSRSSWRDDIYQVAARPQRSIIEPAVVAVEVIWNSGFHDNVTLMLDGVSTNKRLRAPELLRCSLHNHAIVSIQR